MKKFGKILSAVLGIALVLSFAGCSSDDDNNSGGFSAPSGGVPQVAEGTMNLSFTFAEALNAKSIEVLYYKGDGDSSTGKTETAEIANNKASVTLSNAYVNTSGWFNAKITVKTADDTNISNNIKLTSSNTDFGGDCDKAWFKYEEKGTLAVTCSAKPAATAETMTLAFTFAEALNAKSIEVLYYKGDGDSSTGKTETAEIANNKASVTLSNAYVNTSGWFNAKITVKDASADISENVKLSVSTEDATAYQFGGDCAKSWFTFTKDGTLTVNVAKKEDSTPASGTTLFSENVTGDAVKELLSATALDSYTNGTITVSGDWVSGDAKPGIFVNGDWKIGLWNDSANANTQSFSVADLKGKTLGINMYGDTTYTITVTYTPATE